MATTTRTRRNMLKTAGVLGALGAAAAVQDVLPVEAASANPAVGTWLLTATLAGTPPYAVVLVVNNSGTIINTNARNHLNMVDAQYGSWVAQANGGIAYITIGFRYDAKGNPAGTREAHGTLSVNADGNTATLSVTVYTKDVSGKVLATAAGTATGTRVQVK
jgi:hypothetical protein